MICAKAKMLHTDLLKDTPGMSLEATLVEEYSFFTVRFLPPNTTPLIQPMDQQVISNVKKLYTKTLFQRCFEIKHGRSVFQDHAISWKKLWPESIAERGFEVFEDVPVSAVEDIVSLGKSMGLKMGDDDGEELVEDHNTELTTKELQDLQSNRQ
ncbi:hypothetical protein QTO34_006156 [Cnephaeus nilssonii]|uniref:DDE-1 domain-containing protein n=1 Tax=Cnephaeus nilssonii TaxID=3371016 RepID=A0AA40HM75_CNENI|nr:hypothetical protein QTO34_006156 [Eptesicus nilssonii]